MHITRCDGCLRDLNPQEVMTSGWSKRAVTEMEDDGGRITSLREVGIDLCAACTRAMWTCLSMRVQKP
jgi:hypothetical protein